MNTITVTKFNNYVKNIFNAEELLHNINIVGEVFGISFSKTAVYFSIKDEESSLPCVCFYGQDNLKEGDSVVVTGSPNFYTKSGKFNFVVSRIEPFGQGALYQQFMELRDKLSKEGLFDNKHKKSIPESVKRIGIVTSKEGAVLQDIKNVAWRRNPAVDLVLYDTKVQGNGAEFEIANGIKFFSDYPDIDVVVVARGGGSLDDLWAYNTETVARATYECQKPIVSAVGHEVDFTIIDFVADLRAPTPSAAAELLTKDTHNLKIRLQREVSRLSRVLQNYVADKTLLFNGTKNIFIQLFEDRIRQEKLKTNKIISSLSTKLNTMCVENDYKLKLQIANLNKLNPLDILRLGYAKIEQQGRNVGKIHELDISQDFDINFADGSVTIKTGGQK